MNDENPYASPSSSPTDASSGYRLETDVVLPLTETVVFDAVLLSKHEQSMAGCVRPALRAAAIVVGLAAGVFAVGLLVSINRANDLDAPAVVAVIGMVFGIPAVALIAWAIYQPQISMWQLRRVLRKQGVETEQVHYTVSAESLTVKNKIEVREIPWGSFVARYETPDFVIFHLKDGRQQLFPIAQLSPEFLDVLRNG